MNRTTLDFWVGLFVLAGLGALLMLALKVGNLSGFGWSEGYMLNAQFDNIGGLKIRAPVKSAGVVVGRVADIRFDTQQYVANVEMTIDPLYRFPSDTFANINTSGLLGEQYVDLSAGGDENLLKPGDTIKKTQSAIVLENLIGRFLYNQAGSSSNQKKELE
jgi:phospholipid/cholesterol/gamma-HCH transport system substrate-binding protein